MRMNKQGIFSSGKESADNLEDIIEAIPATSLQQGFIYHHISDNDDAYRVKCCSILSAARYCGVKSLAGGVVNTPFAHGVRLEGGATGDHAPSQYW